MQTVDRIVEVMSWRIECDKKKEELECLKAQEDGIEYSRICKDDLANGATKYSNLYLQLIPSPPLPSYPGVCRI